MKNIKKLILANLMLCTCFQVKSEESLPPAGPAGSPAAKESLVVDGSKVLPERYQSRVGVTERFGNSVPESLEFYDQTGKKVNLGDYFDGEKAIVLNLVYFSCPSICNEVLNNLTDSMSRLPWNIGENFRVLSVSIHPKESYGLAYRKRMSYINYYGKPVDNNDWLFLTGKEDDIQVLADTVGFGFEYQEDLGEYAHPAVTILLSPEGKVMRYLEGTEISSLNLKLGLIESGQGKVGNPIDHALLRWCYAYDPKARGYSLMAKKLMTGGGAITAVLMATAMFFLWRREVRNGTIK